MPRDEKQVGSVVTCEMMLSRVIDSARAAVTDPKRQPGTDLGTTFGLDSNAPAAQVAQQRLRQMLEELEPEMAMKLRTLMIAGRDGQDISAVRLNLRLGDADSAFSAAARDTSENGPLLAEYLRRGHAMACAVALDLELPLSGWGSVAAQTLDERAWLSFGKQLASSQPDEWQCLAFFTSGGQEINRLYLKLGDRAWWSFHSVLDRPSASIMTKEKRAWSKRSKPVTTSSLHSLTARLYGPPPSGKAASGRGEAPPAKAKLPAGRALRRATRAIQARVGQVQAP